MKQYDYLIVGAGLFGAVFAQQATKAGKSCLVIDKRDHIAGNIYTENVEGINVHRYGAHIFHTNNKEVWDYVNQFAVFNRYTNSPVANYKGELYNLPFNMNTFNKMWGVVTPAEAEAKIEEQRAAHFTAEPKNLEEQAINLVGTDIYEKLVQKGFLERKGNKKTKVLLPTDKGKALITVMPEEIQSPEMTADWETKLLRIERGEMEPSEFMTEINTMITELVKNTEMKKGANALMKSKIIGVCPNCGAKVVEREKGWFCENRECRFVLWKDNAFFKRLGKRLDSHVADKLLRDGRVRLKDCKSAKGKTYNATVLLSCEADGRSKFSLEFEGGC